MSSTLASAGAPDTDLLGGDVVDRGKRRCACHRPACHPAEQLPDDFGGPLRLGQRRGAFLAHHLGMLSGRDHLLQPHRQRGQRRAQLVGGIGGEIAARRQQVRDALRGAVEALGDLVEFRYPVAAPERPGIARAEPVGCPGEFLKRPGEPPRLQDGERHRNADGEQRERADQQQRPGHPGGDGGVIGLHPDREILGDGLGCSRVPGGRRLADRRPADRVLPDDHIPVRQRPAYLRGVRRQAVVDPRLQAPGERRRVPAYLLGRLAALQAADDEGERQAKQQDRSHRDGES